MTDDKFQLEERLEQRRRTLVDHFCAIPAQAEPMSLQEALAVEIRRSEARNEDPEVWRRHRHLVRIIGDSTAFALLHEHTIRTLDRHPSSQAASLLTQGNDFDLVVQVAKKLAGSGYIPILNDVTNLLKVGDIVAVSPEHVLVLECKNSSLPLRFPKGGRLARQERRGNNAAKYLRESRIIESDNIREAVPIDLPDPEWNFLKDLSRDIALNQNEKSVGLLDVGDGLALALVDPEFRILESALNELVTLVNSDKPIVAMSFDAIVNPRWSSISPLIYPIDPWLRFALLETKVVMIRAIDANRFNVTKRLASGKVANLTARVQKDSGVSLSIEIDEMCHELGPNLIDRVMCSPTRIAALKDALLADVDNIIAMEQEVGLASALSGRSEPRNNEPERKVQLASGDDVTYGTVYRAERSNEYLIVYEIEQLSHDGISHVVWDVGAQEYSAVFRGGTRVDISAEDRRLLKEIRLQREEPPTS